MNCEGCQSCKSNYRKINEQEKINQRANQNIWFELLLNKNKNGTNGKVLENYCSGINSSSYSFLDDTWKQQKKYTLN